MQAYFAVRSIWTSYWPEIELRRVKKKNDFKGEADASLGRAFMKKKNACSAGYEINSTPELYFCLLFGRDFVNRRSFVSWKLELVINENKVLSWWN